jgi:hypothetical protein
MDRQEWMLAIFMAVIILGAILVTSGAEGAL